MAEDDDKPVGDKYQWIEKPGNNSAEVCAQYEAFADDYDDVLLQNWDYRAPHDAAILLSFVAQHDDKILDAGCGTGLTGVELSKQGFGHIIGIDISQKSLAIAAKQQVYQSFIACDLQQKLPFSDNTFDAVQCIGVMAYLNAFDALGELIRVTRPQGNILFSQRTDLAAQAEFQNALSHYINKGLWEKRLHSIPRAYMPGHATFKQDINAIFFLYQKAHTA